MDPFTFHADAQMHLQTVFVTGTHNNSYDVYPTSSMTYGLVGNHGSAINQVQHEASDRALQQFYPVVYNLNSFHGNFPLTNAYSSHDSHQNPVLISYSRSQTDPSHPGFNHRSASSTSSAPTSIFNSSFSTARGAHEPESHARRADEVHFFDSFSVTVSAALLFFRPSNS
jgi:hypothetical protein